MRDRLVLLDIDGVLGASVSCTSDDRIAVRVPGGIAGRVLALSESGEVVWATSWETEVRFSLAAELGMPLGTESVAIVRGPDPSAAKRRAIDRFLRTNEPDTGWVAIVWLDDGIRAAERTWAADSGWPITLIGVDPSGLLTDEHVELARSALQQGAPPTA